MKSTKVVLFDIDGTLCRAPHPVFRESIYYGLETFFNQKFNRIKKDYLSGLTDRGIVKRLAEDEGFILNNKDCSKVFKLMNQYTIKNIPHDYKEYLFENVHKTLIFFRKNNIGLGVITNNEDKRARTKLKLLRINHYFKYFYGGGNTDYKFETAKIARADLDDCFKNYSLTIIGDHIGDFEAAKSIKASFIAVTKDSESKVRFKKLGCKYVIDSFSDYKSIANFI